MATTAIERSGPEERTGTGGAVAKWVAYLGAAAFAIAVVWYGLATHGVTMASEPTPGAGVPVREAQRQFMAWFVTTLHQERLNTGVAVVGFLCLVASAMFARDLIGRDQPLAKMAAAAIAVGSTLWIVGNVAHLGAHRAVGLLSTHDYSTETTSAILFTSDLVDDAFEVAAFATLGVGTLMLARAARHTHVPGRGWEWFTLALGIALLALVMSYVAQLGDLQDLLLPMIGAVLVPIWLVWTGRCFAHPSNDQ
jgi:hypothetical protein